MGLDNFWKKDGRTDRRTLAEKDQKFGIDGPTFEPPLRLCGGLFSGNGEGSFRGKVYAALVENVTGHSLYADVISNDVVRLIAEALEKTQADKTTDAPGSCYDISDEEFDDLVRMFRAYADAGFELHAWY